LIFFLLCFPSVNKKNSKIKINIFVFIIFIFSVYFETRKTEAAGLRFQKALASKFAKKHTETVEKVAKKNTQKNIYVGPKIRKR
jgi:hypothetical protein